MLGHDSGSRDMFGMFNLYGRWGGSRPSSCHRNTGHASVCLHSANHRGLYSSELSSTGSQIRAEPMPEQYQFPAPPAYNEVSWACFLSMAEEGLSHWEKTLHMWHLLSNSPAQWSCWGGGGGGGILVSLRPSVRLSVRPSRIPCLLCSAYSSGWIHFIFIHLIKQLQKVCRV